MVYFRVQKAFSFGCNKKIKKRKKVLAFSLHLCIIAIVEFVNGSLVKRLRRRPLTAETGVRFPYELLKATEFR